MPDQDRPADRPAETAKASESKTVLLGRIVRLQVQRDPIKVGKAPLRRYEPAVLTSVVELSVDQRGAVGRRSRTGADHESVLDVHHQDHPLSRDRKGKAGLTLMATGDYANLRRTYGDHLVDGIAGESMLIDHPGLAGLDFPGGLTVHTADGPVGLGMVRVAEPCVEFTRFCLSLPPEPVVGDDVREGLADLDCGRRGYRAVASGSGVIRLGDVITSP